MKRPLPVTITGWFFIAAGSVGFVYHASELKVQDLFANDTIWLLLIRVLAIGGAILILRGSNAGRWLLVTWMGYHVVLSYFHTLSELVIHIIFLALITYILFHPRVSTFFK